MLKLCADAESVQPESANGASESSARASESHRVAASGMRMQASSAAAAGSGLVAGGSHVRAVHASTGVATGVMQALLQLPLRLWEHWLGALWPEVDLRGVRMSCIEWGNIVAALGRAEQFGAKVLSLLIHCLACSVSNSCLLSLLICLLQLSNVCCVFSTRSAMCSQPHACLRGF